MEARREAERLRARLAAEAAEREEMLAVVSHELRTPVTVISGFHRLLLSEEVGPLTADQRRFLEEAARSCRWLDRFIADLSEATAAGAAGEVSARSGSLESVVRDVVRFLQPLFAEAKLEVEVSVARGAERALFEPVRIEQVLTNLLGNAIRHAPARSTVRVDVRCKTEGGREFVEVAICDSGPGVALEDRARIFRPYVRGTGSRGGSLGLGLSIARRIVEAHHGALEYEPGERGGSRFVFTLPAAERDA
jgi:signal transduction histidine kinase